MLFDLLSKRAREREREKKYVTHVSLIYSQFICLSFILTNCQHHLHDFISFILIRYRVSPLFLQISCSNSAVDKIFLIYLARGRVENRIYA